MRKSGWHFIAREDSVNWSYLKKILIDADKNELIDIVRDFYELPAENRQEIFPGT